MFRNQEIIAIPAADNDAAGNLDEMIGRLGIETGPAKGPRTRPASWPTGVSLLAQMIDACQRCEAIEVCDDWLTRAPAVLMRPPAFCPNADALKQAQKTK